VTDLPSRIIDTMSSIAFVDRTYPMLTAWGVRDEDVFVHSLGCSAWNALGHEFGYMAVSECPAPVTFGSDIRADSTWFCKNQCVPTVLIEFERFDGTGRGQEKLNEKLCNLMDAAMRWKYAPTVLILSTWSKGVVSAPDTDALLKRCREGFKSTIGAHVPPLKNTVVLFSRFLFEVQNGGALFLRQTKCTRLA
jgi:hypothetical protein